METDFTNSQLDKINALIEQKLSDFKNSELNFKRWDKLDSVTDQFSPITGGSSQIGFFGTSKTTKPTVTGSRGGNAALASLLTKLAGLGLLTDSSS